MSGITDLWLFVVAGVILNLTPGPDMAFVAGQGARAGVRGGIAAALGVGAGCFVHIAAAAFGLSAIIATSATAFTLLKLAGAAYLIYAGIAMLRAQPAAAPLPDGAEVRDAAATKDIFVQGFVINALNPKVALFFLAFLPQFIAADAPSKAMAFAILGLIFNVTGTAWNVLVGWSAARAAMAFAPGRGVRVWLERTLGIVFIGLGLKLALAQRTT